MIIAQAPSKMYQPQEIPLGPIDMQPDWRTLRVTMTREAWPADGDTTIIIGKMELLGGGIVVQRATCAFQGGVYTLSNGTVLAANEFNWNIPGVGTLGRQARATFSVLMALRTAVTFEVLT